MEEKWFNKIRKAYSQNKIPNPPSEIPEVSNDSPKKITAQLSGHEVSEEASVDKKTDPSKLEIQNERSFFTHVKIFNQWRKSNKIDWDNGDLQKDIAKISQSGLRYWAHMIYNVLVMGGAFAAIGFFIGGPIFALVLGFVGTAYALLLVDTNIYFLNLFDLVSPLSLIIFPAAFILDLVDDVGARLIKGFEKLENFCFQLCHAKASDADCSRALSSSNYVPPPMLSVTSRSVEDETRKDDKTESVIPNSLPLNSLTPK